MNPPLRSSRTNLSKTACGALLSLALVATAQVNLSSIGGLVTDAQGNRIPGALVVMTAPSTGLVRQTQTSSDGTYFAPDLPVGLYVVAFSKPGFATLRIGRVLQEVGQSRTLDARLEVAVAKQEASIVEPLVEIDRAGATVGTAVEQTQISELPLNGRNWANLTALAPGAINNGSGDQRTIRFAGHGLDDNNLTLDGVDATAVFNQEQREYMRLNVPLDSISEFQVQSQNFGADVEGGTAGGQVAVVSPSGTNVFHGDLFDYFRNNTLDARGPFDGSSPAPLLLNQFGAALGGPIVRDKTFFYTSYEGLRQHVNQTQIGLVPSPAFDQAAESTSPVLASLLAAYPHGTSPTSNPNVWNYVATGQYVDNEDSGMVRLDQRFSDRTTAFIRFNTDEAVGLLPTGQLNDLTEYDTKFLNGLVDLSNVITPNLINVAKFGVNQTIYHSAKLSPVPFSLSVPSFSSVTGSSTSDDPSKTFDLLDDVAWVKGTHTLKFGAEIRWIAMNQGSSASETLTYGSAALLESNRMASASYTALMSLKRQRKTQYWGYVQDEWRATPNLTITAGVRYNFFNVFHEIDHRAIPFDFATCGGYCSPYDSFSHPRYNDLDPRLAIAWSLGGGTVLRLGGGIYHTDGQEDDQNLPISNDVDRYSFSNSNKLWSNLSYPLGPFLAHAENGGLGVISPRDLDRNRKDDYVAAWTASVEHKLPGNIVGTATYLGNKGTDVLTTTYVNLANPLTGVVPYLQFGPVSWRGNVGNSTFHAFQLNARREFQDGLQLSANYMWSHSINDGSIGGGESDTPQDSFCRSCDKASSDDDVRQMFNASAVYQLPFGAGKRFLSTRSPARAIFGGWELSTIITAQTGLPVNITYDPASSSLVPGGYIISGEMRPNLVPGVSLTPPGGSTPNNWIDLSAFSVPAPGTFGNLGRNAFRAPGLTQVDLGLSKYVSITERIRIRLRADVFNVFNRAQYAAPNADISAPQNFGVITSTISSNSNPIGEGTPREFQLSAKIMF